MPNLPASRAVALGVTALAVAASGVGLAVERGPARSQPASSHRPAPLLGQVRSDEAAAAAAPTVRSGGATTSSAASLYPLPAPPAYPSPCPPPPYNPPPPIKRGNPKVARADLPRVLQPLPVQPSLGAIRGKGMWITTWADTPIHARAWVHRARANGVHQLWVRTGGTITGWYGGHLLRQLLPRAHRAGIKVIAWDFPTFSDPVADAHRARRTVKGVFAGQQVDGFSADIEQASEGVFLSKIRVKVYLSRVRGYLRHRPLVATVYRPSDYEWSIYPYKAEARFVDAFAPMVYWSCDEPGADTAQAVDRLRTLRPVHPIGQAYDMGAYGGRPGLPTGREIWRFLDVAKRHNAVGASLYTWNTADRQEWKALHYYPWTPR
jgi:hypothetical protein